MSYLQNISLSLSHKTNTSTKKLKIENSFSLQERIIKFFAHFLLYLQSTFFFVLSKTSLSQLSDRFSIFPIPKNSSRHVLGLLFKKLNSYSNQFIPLISKETNEHFKKISHHFSEIIKKTRKITSNRKWASIPVSLAAVETYLFFKFIFSPSLTSSEMPIGAAVYQQEMPFSYYFKIYSPLIITFFIGAGFFYYHRWVKNNSNISETNENTKNELETIETTAPSSKNQLTEPLSDPILENEKSNPEIKKIIQNYTMNPFSPSISPTKTHLKKDLIQQTIDNSDIEKKISKELEERKLKINESLLSLCKKIENLDLTGLSTEKISEIKIQSIENIKPDEIQTKINFLEEMNKQILNDWPTNFLKKKLNELILELQNFKEEIPIKIDLSDDPKKEKYLLKLWNYEISFSLSQDELTIIKDTISEVKIDKIDQRTSSKEVKDAFEKLQIIYSGLKEKKYYSLAKKLNKIIKIFEIKIADCKITLDKGEINKKRFKRR